MTDSLKKLVLNHLNYIHENSSAHGGIWIAKLPWGIIRVPLQLIYFGIQLMIVCSVVYFLTQTLLIPNTSVSQVHYDNLDYPNITVCNPRPFDRTKVKGLNLTQEDITLLSLPTFFQDYGYIMEKIINNPVYFKEKLNLMAQNHDWTTLTHELLLGCEHFIISCMNGKGQLPCCGKNGIFDPKPMLSSQGVCFTTREPLSHKRTGTLSLVLYSGKEVSMGLNLSLSGPTRAMTSPSIAFHHSDHPLVAMEMDSQVLQLGTVEYFRLKLSKENMTNYKTGLDGVNGTDSGYCVLPNSKWSQWIKTHGFTRWTLNNCEYLLYSLIVQNCSVLESQGIKANFPDNEATLDVKEKLEAKIGPISNQIPCNGLDIFNVMNLDDEQQSRRIDSIMEQASGFCLQSCESITTDVHHTTTHYDVSTYEDYNYADGVHVIVKYASTNIIEFKVNFKGAWDVVSDYGGVLGFICGASMISLLEVSGFCICLLWKSAKNTLTRTACRNSG